MPVNIKHSSTASNYDRNVGYVPEPKRSFARTGAYEVLLAGGTTCPHCSRLLRADDVVIVDVGDVSAGFGDVSLVCGGCHNDVLIIRGAA
jgi:hypothetical protein